MIIIMMIIIIIIIIQGFLVIWKAQLVKKKVLTPKRESWPKE